MDLFSHFWSHFNVLYRNSLRYMVHLCIWTFYYGTLYFLGQNNQGKKYKWLASDIMLYRNSLRYGVHLCIWTFYYGTLYFLGQNNQGKKYKWLASDIMKIHLKRYCSFMVYITVNLWKKC